MREVVHRKELGDFVRFRREAIDLISVGLDPDPRRRTPGLRREELAQLSGLSISRCTCIEQGCELTVSRLALDSHARVLGPEHPQLGRLELDCLQLQPANNNQQHLLVFMPSDSESAAELQLLCGPEEGN